jgi:hypothetical protein
MKGIYRIILDVDDVLNSLSLHVLRHYGCSVGQFDYEAFPHYIGYNIMRAVVELGGKSPSDVPSFWDGVTRANLWRTAPKSPQCDWLLDRAAALVGRGEVYLATTPTKDPQSHADKLHWIWDNLPSWIHRQYFITPRKWLLGKPGVLLFDDHLENCERFIEEDGESFLVPRPWNPKHAENTDDALENKFRSIAHV